MEFGDCKGAWIGFTWLKRRVIGVILWLRDWTIWFTKVKEITWVDIIQVDFYERLS
jgi:hypothetical protein